MKLPPLDDNKANKKEEAANSLKLPEIDLLYIDEDREKFKKHFKEIISDDEDKANEKEKSNKEHQDKQKALEGTYRNMIEMFNEKENSEELLETYEKEIKKMGLYDLEKLEEAIENGKLDTSKYDIFALSKLLQKLEKTQPVKSLESYNMKSIEEFYMHVTSGKLDVSKYDEEELDDFIDKLAKRK